MQNFLIRALYAVVGWWVFWLVFPLFLDVISLNIPGNLMQLLRIITACLALIYVLYPSVPPKPWQTP